MRKKAGFQIADRIRTYYQGDADIRRVMERHGDYIRAETLSRELVEGLAPPGRAIPLRGSPGPGGSGIKGAYGESQRVDGHPVALAVERVE